MPDPIILGSTHPPLARWHAEGRIDGWPGDATYGWNHARLMTPQPLPPEPDDFVAFWQRLAAEADALPPTLALGDAVAAPPALADTHDVREATYESLGGARIGCWVVLPRDGSPTRNLTVGHGYGGRTGIEPDEALLGPEVAAILPVCRGLPALSLDPTIPATAQQHVLHGIEHRDGYVLGGCVADLWRATAELDALVGEHPRRYKGGSFGGGLGAMALMDGRYGRAALSVPTFGNHPLRVTLPSVGSGAGISQRHDEHPEILDVLAYFDAATAASHVDTPTMVCAALWDPAVPPPGQFAVHHALAGDKQLVVQDCGHTEFPGAEEQTAGMFRAFRDWLR